MQVMSRWEKKLVVEHSVLSIVAQFGALSQDKSQQTLPSKSQGVRAAVDLCFVFNLDTLDLLKMSHIY